MSTYSETLDWLFSQLASFQRIGKDAYKEDLSNISAICTVLENPQNKFKSIHLAGTNGKGSSSHLLASIFQEQGYHVGLFTSPHLKDFRERIRLNGQLISEDYVIDFVQKNKKTFVEIGLSFFEMTTALAFQYFADKKVDIAIIETGLGGRLDATNIIKPELSIITNVALDHQNLLGNTIAQIAVEKAGIIKKNTPVIVGATCAVSTSEISKVADVNHAKVYFSVAENDFTSALKGDCQQENTNTVVKAIEVLNKGNWHISDKALLDGLQNVVLNTGLRGRWELIANKPRVICDTGHNKHAIKSIVEQLEKEVYQRLWIVLGMVADKDIRAVLGLLPINATYIFCQASIPRAISASDLAEKAAMFDLKGQVIASPVNALKKAQELANEEDLIFVGGSTFTVAEVL